MIPAGLGDYNPITVPLSAARLDFNARIPRFLVKKTGITHQGWWGDVEIRSVSVPMTRALRCASDKKQ
jgi:hypothetical protein